ncbi:MAG: hypothetical protein WCK74_00080 [Gemmatimonadaceae bacterium]
MHTYPLRLQDGHLFVTVDGQDWLLDTGAPSSFGSVPSVTLGEQTFGLDSDYLGLSASTLTDHVGVPCVGLLGADVLGPFDHRFDLQMGTHTLSAAELTVAGESVALASFMGIPIVSLRCGDTTVRMFFDTGAQISYFQDETRTIYPSAGALQDFYPGVGQFETTTHWVPMHLGSLPFTLRCGELPGLLGMTLLLAGTQGIVGNEILRDRVVGYFPRRGLLVL